MAKRRHKITKRLADRQAGYTGEAPNKSKEGVKLPGSKNARKVC